MIENLTKDTFLSSILFNQIKERYPEANYCCIEPASGEEHYFIGIRLTNKNSRSTLSSTEESGIRKLILKLKAEFEKSLK